MEPPMWKFRLWLDLRRLRRARRLVLAVAIRPNRSETNRLRGEEIATEIGVFARHITPIPRDNRRFKFIY
jgi:hypothetical protein